MAVTSAKEALYAATGPLLDPNFERALLGYRFNMYGEPVSRFKVTGELQGYRPVVASFNTLSKNSHISMRRAWPNTYDAILLYPDPAATTPVVLYSLTPPEMKAVNLFNLKKEGVILRWGIVKTEELEVRARIHTIGGPTPSSLPDHLESQEIKFVMDRQETLEVARKLRRAVFRKQSNPMMRSF